MKPGVALFLLLGACARGENEPLPTSLPAGTYDVSGPTCLSTGEPPAYPSPSYKLALLDLDAVTAHTITLDAAATVETISDADCTLAITRSLYRNFGGEFVLSADRRHAFTPAGCTLAVTVDEYSYPIGPDYSSGLADSTDKSPEIAFVVARPDPASYEVASADRPDYDAAWGPFGCAASDRIVYSYKAK